VVTGGARGYRHPRAHMPACTQTRRRPPAPPCPHAKTGTPLEKAEVLQQQVRKKAGRVPLVLCRTRRLKRQFMRRVFPAV